MRQAHATRWLAAAVAALLAACQAVQPTTKDTMTDTPAPLRVVAPAELPVCEDCSADTDWSPSPTVAEVAYRGAGGASWRVPVCELHVRPTVRWLLAHTATADVQVLIPAPTVPLSPPAPVLALPQPSSAVELGVSA